MKIKISEIETYEISLPETIEYAQLDVMIARLHSIKKMMGKDVINSSGTSITKVKTYRKWKRDELIDALSIYYNDKLNIKQKTEKVEKIINYPYKKFSNRAIHLRKAHNIKPSELGLKEFKVNNK